MKKDIKRNLGLRKCWKSQVEKRERQKRWDAAVNRATNEDINHLEFDFSSNKFLNFSPSTNKTQFIKNAQTKDRKLKTIVFRKTFRKDIIKKVYFVWKIIKTNF